MVQTTGTTSHLSRPGRWSTRLKLQRPPEGSAQVDGNVAKIDLAARGVDGALVHFNAPSWAVRAVMSSTTLPVCPKTGSTSPSLTVHLCLHTALLREIGNAPVFNFPKSVFNFARNRCSTSPEIGVQLPPKNPPSQVHRLRAPPPCRSACRRLETTPASQPTTHAAAVRPLHGRIAAGDARRCPAPRRRRGTAGQVCAADDAEQVEQAARLAPARTRSSR